MIKVLLIDNFGFYIEDQIIPDDQPLTANQITVEFPSGLYKPRWIEDHWIEGATPEEIEEIENPD